MISQKSHYKTWTDIQKPDMLIKNIIIGFFVILNFMSEKNNMIGNEIY